MTKLQKLFMFISALFLLIVLGCSAFQDAITPCYIDPDVATYANEPLTEMLPYTTLFDAKRIKAKMDYIYDSSKLKHFYLLGELDYHILGAEETKQMVFSPEGPIGMLAIGLPAFSLGWLGVSKPADRKRIVELENGGNK